MNIRLLITYIRIKLLSMLPMFAVLDGEDQSVSLSRRLFRAMCLLGLKENNKVYVFKVADRYAFAVNPRLGEESNLYTVQYNPQYRTVGFCPTCPSVVRILVDYGRPYSFKGKLGVRVCYAKGVTYFKFLP